MSDPSDAAEMAPGHASDQASTPDQDQKILIGEVDREIAPGLDLAIVKDEKAGVYDAIAGGQEVGGLIYNVSGDRIVLVSVSVFPQFRNQGAATKIIQHVLDDVRTQGKTATVLCPIVRTYIDNHPEYQDVVDPEHPGVVKVVHR